MSYRTILVHLNDSRRARALLGHASEIARAFEARLIGLHVSPMIHRHVVDRDYPSGQALEGLKFSRDEEADHLRSIFEDVTSSQRVSGEFRSVIAERISPISIAVGRARGADLAIASQSDPRWPLSSLLDCPERLAIECGRPVLIVPNQNTSPALPNRVVMAWDRTREAARAIFEAVPLLKGAKSVELLTLEQPDSDEHLDVQLDQSLLPASAVAEAMSAHGIKLAITTLRSAGDAGEQICAHAAQQCADLVVMGAYGHSRLREFVFGGATHYVLQNMAVPVLFAH